MKNTLTNEHKHFIIIQLARFCSPSEIVAAMKSEFGVQVSRQQVSHYDPTVNQCKGKLKPEWIELFEQAHANFVKDISKPVFLICPTGSGRLTVSITKPREREISLWQCRFLSRRPKNAAAATRR
jgi:hypothetical protein